jgi:hypothetical protein
MLFSCCSGCAAVYKAMSAPSKALGIAISESAGDHVAQHWNHNPG